MNKRLVLSLSIIVLASAGIVTNASAAEKTRAEVRQELIQAENSGLRFVTDTSYPDVNPIFAQQVAHLKQQQSGTGADTSGSSAAGHREAADSTSVAQGRTATPACVGPVSFCTPYFGS
ncbi:DUF4148 domain-containing protein [Paraburkholderia sp. FT54]|uniref:DUF4148 domain-containing protein n=1 Tax=Paraburkholderia sp. FT54 TaxID=3074437 RepID=UPI0028775944|nr:DUF4148 domain-containing protein [Paraburkholderia sp. FT54]WNC89131.1 DUF4148 domain-containing protein [Paraburkholderia sp. FT54]